RATVSIGAGQMSRIDSARIAARKADDAAKAAGLQTPLTKGSVVASDAFFPFADGLLAAVEAGATAVIQPGGSVRDDEGIKAADDHRLALGFTDTRHFRHLLFAGGAPPPQSFPNTPPRPPPPAACRPTRGWTASVGAGRSGCPGAGCGRPRLGAARPRPRPL